MELVLVLTTVPNHKVADAIAKALLDARLAACISSSTPIRSRYRWQGEIKDDEEIALTIKTTRERLVELKTAILAHHPYEVPEILVLPIEDAHGPYAKWVENETKGGES